MNLPSESPGSGPFMCRNLLGHEPCHDFDPQGTGSRMHSCNLNLDKDMADLVAAGLDPSVTPAGGGRGVTFHGGMMDDDGDEDEEPALPNTAYTGFGERDAGFSVQPLLDARVPFVDQYIERLGGNTNTRLFIGNIQQLLETSAYVRLLSISSMSSLPDSGTDPTVGVPQSDLEQFTSVLAAELGPSIYGGGLEVAAMSPGERSAAAIMANLGPEGVRQAAETAAAAGAAESDVQEARKQLDLERIAYIQQLRAMQERLSDREKAIEAMAGGVEKEAAKAELEQARTKATATEAQSNARLMQLASTLETALEVRGQRDAQAAVVRAQIVAAKLRAEGKEEEAKEVEAFVESLVALAAAEQSGDVAAIALAKKKLKAHPEPSDGLSTAFSFLKAMAAMSTEDQKAAYAGQLSAFTWAQHRNEAEQLMTAYASLATDAENAKDPREEAQADEHASQMMSQQSQTVFPARVYEPSHSFNATEQMPYGLGGGANEDVATMPLFTFGTDQTNVYQPAAGIMPPTTPKKLRDRDLRLSVKAEGKKKREEKKENKRQSLGQGRKYAREDILIAKREKEAAWQEAEAAWQEAEARAVVEARSDSATAVALAAMPPEQREAALARGDVGVGAHLALAVMNDMNSDVQANAAAYSRLNQSFACLKLRFNTIEVLADVLTRSLISTPDSIPPWFGIDPLPWWRVNGGQDGSGFKGFFRGVMSQLDPTASLDQLEWFSLADWEAAVSIAMLERDRLEAAAAGGYQASPQLKASQAIRANELLVEAYTHLYNSTYSPLITADVDFVNNGMLLFLMAALQGGASQFLDSINLRKLDQTRGLVQAEIAALLYAGAHSQPPAMVSSTDEQEAFLQARGYDMTLVDRGIDLAAAEGIIQGMMSQASDTTPQSQILVAQALAGKVADEWARIVPDAKKVDPLATLWMVSYPLPAVQEAARLATGMSILERKWMQNELTWSNIENKLVTMNPMVDYDTTPDPNRAWVGFLQRRGWNATVGPNGCIYRGETRLILPPGTSDSCQERAGQGGGGKKGKNQGTAPKKGKTDKITVPRAKAAFQDIFNRFFSGPSAQSANSVALSVGKLIGKEGTLEFGGSIPAPGQKMSEFREANPDWKWGVDIWDLDSAELQAQYARWATIMGSAKDPVTGKLRAGAWEAFDAERMEETFSYYTPAVVYWINKGVRIWYGTWYKNDTFNTHPIFGADLSIPLKPPVKGRSQGASPDERQLFAELLGKCQENILHYLKVEVIEHLFATYDGIFANTPTLVNANLTDTWGKIRDSLKANLESMWTKTFNQKFGGPQAGALFGAGGKSADPQSGVLHVLNDTLFATTAAFFMKFSTSDTVDAELLKQFSRQLTFTSMESVGKVPSQALKNFANELLRQQCALLDREIVGLDGLPGGGKPSGGKALLWWREWFCINKVANWTGSVGSIDTALIRAFKVAATTDDRWKKMAIVDAPLGSTIAKTVGVLRAEIPADNRLGITNNAMTTKIPGGSGEKIVKQLYAASAKIVQDCSIEATTDGMGTFGDCGKGTASDNYHCTDLDVTIQQRYKGDKATALAAAEASPMFVPYSDDNWPLRFYFNMNVRCSTTKNEVNVVYDLKYSNQDRKGLKDKDPGNYQSPYLHYRAEMTNSKCVVLEANALLLKALHHIKSQSYAHSIDSVTGNPSGLSGAKNWKELFATPYMVAMSKGGADMKTNTFGHYIMTIFLGDKYMGDFGQGLYVLANAHSPFPRRAAADGDRPSYVRNSTLALEAVNDGGINPNSKLFYANSIGEDVYGTFVRKTPWATSDAKTFVPVVGGGKRRTRRKRPRARKTRRKGQKTKNKKTRIRKRRGQKPTRERKACRHAKTSKRFVFRK